MIGTLPLDVKRAARAVVASLLEADDADEWIGVDFDGTLAKYNGWKGATKLGEPIPKMVARIRRWVGHGKKVKIFTARADDERSVNAIKKWLKDNELPDLEVTNLKDEHMTELWDDRAVAVQKNTGEVKEDASRVNPKDMERALDFLRKRNPAGFAQLSTLPFGPVPSYAWENPASDWWSSQEAFSTLTSIRQAGHEGIKPLMPGPRQRPPSAQWPHSAHEDPWIPKKFQYDEAIVGDEPETLAQIEAILDEVASDPRLPLEDFVQKANERLIHFRIKFTNDHPIFKQYGAGALVHYGGWMYLRILSDVLTTLYYAKQALNHEFVHQRQHQAGEQRRPGGGDEMIASTDRLMFKGGRVNHGGYYDVPQEMMAYAKSAVDAAREDGLSDDELLQRLRSGKPFPGDHYIQSFRDRKGWNRVLRYMSDYLTRRAESMAVVEHLLNEDEDDEDDFDWKEVTRSPLPVGTWVTCTNEHDDFYGQEGMITHDLGDDTYLVQWFGGPTLGYTRDELAPSHDVEEALLAESPEIKTLKKNQVKLDPEEREQVMKAGAVWHMGKDGAASPAVRKAVVNGKTWYWCATHRYGQVRSTLAAAIKTFPAVEATA